MIHQSYHIIIQDNNSKFILQQVSQYKYLGTDGCEEDEYDVKSELTKFNKITDLIKQNQRKNLRYKTMAVAALRHGMA